MLKVLPWQQLLLDIPQNLISSRSSSGKYTLKVKAVEHPQTLRPKNIQSVAMATAVVV